MEPMLLSCHLITTLSTPISFAQSHSLTCFITRQELQCWKCLIGAKLDYYTAMMHTIARLVLICHAEPVPVDGMGEGQTALLLDCL